jgi:hypothetical protein
MARAAGKRNKKRGKRRGLSRPRNRAVANISLADAKVSARYPAIYAFEDSNGSTPFAGDSPAFDRPELLPELVCLQLMAVRHFELYAGPRRPEPSKETLIDFFMSVPLSSGRPLERHLASAAATFVRSVSRMRGGRPRNQPKLPATPAVSREAPTGDGPVSENG